MTEDQYRLLEADMLELACRRYADGCHVSGRWVGEQYAAGCHRIEGSEVRDVFLQEAVNKSCRGMWRRVLEMVERGSLSLVDGRVVKKGIDDV